MKKLLAVTILLTGFQFFPQTLFAADQFDFNWAYAQYSCRQGNNTSTVWAQSNVFAICHSDPGSLRHIETAKQFAGSAEQAAQAVCPGGTMTLVTWGGGNGPNYGPGAQAAAQRDHDQWWRSRHPLRDFFVSAPYSRNCR